MKFLLIILPFFLISCTEQETKIEGVEMGMKYKVLIREHVPAEKIPAIKKIIKHAFSEIDTKLNGWNPNSEISAWNRSTSTEKIPTSAVLLEVVNLADQVYKLSNGRFDPSFGRVIARWKQCLKLGLSLNSDEIRPLMACSGWDKIIIHSDGLQKTHPHVAIDFDGISKGFLCDLIKRELQTFGLKKFLVEWAGEIQTLGGPFRVLSGGEVILLTDLGIATSGSTYHFYPIKKGDKEICYSHFIDPRTFEPAPVLSLPCSKSIIDKSCAIADGLATSSYIPMN